MRFLVDDPPKIAGRYTDKADEIVKWIKEGLLSEEQMELFKNTDFNNNKEVTTLWERLNKELF